VQIELVPCSADDKSFVFEVTEDAMRSYVEQAFGSWDRDRQRHRSDALFDPATYRLIVADGRRAGILVVENRPAEVFLARIFLLPDFQRRGIGSVLVRQLIDRAAAERKPLRLRVLRVNVDARRLYERLGLILTASTSDHHYLEHLPPEP
jgi:GNAT superfamily N-acetyltransferase